MKKAAALGTYIVLGLIGIFILFGLIAGSYSLQKFRQTHMIGTDDPQAATCPQTDTIISFVQEALSEYSLLEPEKVESYPNADLTWKESTIGEETIHVVQREEVINVLDTAQHGKTAVVGRIFKTEVLPRLSQSGLILNPALTQETPEFTQYGLKYGSEMYQVMIGNAEALIDGSKDASVDNVQYSTFISIACAQE